MHVVSAPPAYETIALPQVGETTTAQVGDPIITMSHQLSMSAIRFGNACAFSEKFDRPGTGTGTVEFKVDEGAVFARENTSNGVPGYCGAASQLTPPFGYVSVKHCVATNGEGIVSFPGSEMIVQSDCRVAPQVLQADAPDSVKKELLYDGRTGATVHLSYREFVRDFARPAFTQELSYDISTDHVIGFRGARIEIIDANNTSIRYRVLSGF